MLPCDDCPLSDLRALGEKPMACAWCELSERARELIKVHPLYQLMVKLIEALPQKEEPMRPSRDQTLMEVATTFAARGTCLRLEVGAVIAKEGRVISTGYVGAPRGIAHCSVETCNHKAPCERTIHAEMNAIVMAARWGISVEGCSLYTTHGPCLKCAQAIINAGISEVVFLYPFRDITGVNLLTEAGVGTRPPNTDPEP